MSPSSQKNMKQIKSTMKFLKKHQWMFSYPNTHILVQGVLDNFPSDWIPHLKDMTNDELNELPFGGINEEWPSSLKTFIKHIEGLKYEIPNYNVKEEIELPDVLRISPKKAHEITALAGVIHDICKRQNLSIVVDVGCGLGYISQLLYEKYSYRVLGIESDETKTELAVEKQEEFHSHTKDFVKYVHHSITENSMKEIKKLLKANFPDWQEEEGICLTGLHACADLSVTAMKMFSELEYFKSLIIMPCCYHLLEVVTVEDKDRFKHFPMSKQLKSVHKKKKALMYMRRPFLRLACQQSSLVWRNMSAAEHEKQSRGCIFRAIVQDVADKGW